MSQSSRDTPHCEGPWTAEEQKSKGGRSLGWIINHGNGRIGWSSYATARPNAGEEPPYPISAANARLISAAPDLLAALERALRDSGCDGDLCMHTWHEIARDAIRKAREGE